MSTLIAYFLGVATGVVFRSQFVAMWDKIDKMRKTKTMPLDVLDEGTVQSEPVKMEMRDSKLEHKVNTN